jgi:hypothetical protein
MSQAKLHHQTAQAYLRNFADPDGRVLVYDRVDGEFRPLTHVKNVAAISRLYTFKDLDGNASDAFEQGPLARIDGLAAAHLPKLLEPMPKLTTRERIDIDSFLTMQVARTSAFRDFLADSHDLSLRFDVELNVAGAPSEEVERFIDEHYPEATESGRAEIRRLAADPSQRAELLTIDWINAIMEHHSAWMDLVIVRPWVFVRPEGDTFLTCDNPVVLVGPHPVGIGTAPILHWPLSPNRALWRVLPGSQDRHSFQTASAPPDLVAELNQMTADQATRQIIWQPGTNPIANITPLRGPQLRSINGIPVGPGESSYDKIRPHWSHILDTARARRKLRVENRQE